MARRKRLLLAALAACILLPFVAEIGLRFAVGLGESPYRIDDPQTEYRLAPGRTYHRQGNTIHYNAYSMRSGDFPRTKSDPNETRVLFIGDSIINGGAQTDQAALATEQIGQRLREELGTPVVVGNISASSWGPENMLGYLKKFGLFDADVLVIVVSSHDATDKMPDLSYLKAESEPYGGSRFALQEVVVRLSQRLASPPTRPAAATDQADCIGAFEAMIELARSQGIKVIVAQHLEAAESPGHELPGHGVLLAAAERHGATVVQLGPSFAAAIASGRTLYRDAIHPNVAGQAVIADTIYPVVRESLRPATSAP